MNKPMTQEDIIKFAVTTPIKAYGDGTIENADGYEIAECYKMGEPSDKIDEATSILMVHRYNRFEEVLGALEAAYVVLRSVKEVSPIAGGFVDSLPTIIKSARELKIN